MSEVDSAPSSPPSPSTVGPDSPIDSASSASKEPAPAFFADRAPLVSEAPVLRAAGFLRFTALVAVVSTVLGVLVMPGAKGLLGDAVIGPLSRVTWSMAYLMAGLVIAACVLACFELSRAMRMAVGTRVIAIAGAGAVLAFSAPALIIRLPTPVTLAMSFATILVTFAGVWEGLRAQHTRGVALIAGAFGVAGMLHVVAWEVGTIAGDRARTDLYAVAQGVATAAVAFEALGQMATAAWLGTRSRVMGQGLSSVAVGAAFVLTWGAAHGASATAAGWQAGLHTALAGAPGLPPPFALGALATFLVCASMLLALASALQPRQVVAVVCSLSLALLGRGSFDVPLRALAATAASLWLMVALIDDRAMWKSLIEQREQRLAEEREASGG